jgi:hypothetical protein
MASLDQEREIVERIWGLTGSEAEAIAWYQSQPIPALDGLSAKSLVENGDTAAVREYLDHIAIGGFA